MKKLRVGVIGVGSIGQHHARIYDQIQEVDLIAISDINCERVSRLAKTYNIRGYTNYQDLFCENLDAVSIAVPTSYHKVVAVSTISKGINVLVEKPIADTLDNAYEIINAAKHKGVKLMVGHVERFNPVVTVIKESISGSKVVSIDITRVGPIPPEVEDVGVVVDLAVHDIDLLRYLTDSEFKTAYGLTSRNISNREDAAMLSFEMENGVLAHITVDWLTPFKVREINVATTDKFVKGWLIDQKAYEYIRYPEDDNAYLVRQLNIRYAEPLKMELENFIECIENDVDPHVTGQDGLKALEIAQLCLKWGQQNVER